MAILTGKIIISHGILDILEVPEPQEFHWHVRVIQCKCTNPFVVKRGKSTGCQRDVSLKTSGLRAVVVVSMSTIMLTTSSCHHQVVWKCNSSEACEFTGENTLGCETLFFPGNAASGVAEVGPLFPQLRASTKSAQDCSESSICTSKCENVGMRGALLEDEIGGSE